MTTYRTIDGDMVDAICKAHYGTEAMVVAVYEANPGLAELGPVLDKGHLISLPEMPAHADDAVVRPVRLWG
ncbi:MAG: tail protein X [Rhodobacteraceae bacterium]|nr:tail protein X [Paracoccaceae bacterium]MCW9041756.1 tail protein X [Pseudopelagicola sp.]